MDTVPGEQHGLRPAADALLDAEIPSNRHQSSRTSSHARRVERLMLARRWWWSCVYVGSTVVVFVLSFPAGRIAILWQMGLAWLLTMGYLVVIVKTRTRRGPWGSRFRSELQEPEFWRETRTLSGGRVGGHSAARSDVLDAARRDASDWLSGIGITTLIAVVFLAPACGCADRPAVFFPVIGGALRSSHLRGIRPGPSHHDAPRPRRPQPCRSAPAVGVSGIGEGVGRKLSVAVHRVLGRDAAVAYSLVSADRQPRVEAIRRNRSSAVSCWRS